MNAYSNRAEIWHTKGLIKANLSTRFSRNLMNIHGVMTDYLRKIRLKVCHAHRVNHLKESAENCYVDGVTREKRKLNLIVHNLPESTSAEASVRKNEDTQNVTSLINKYIGVNAHISNVTRIGKQTGRPRLTKVTLTTREEKFKILRNRLNLRKKEHPTHVTKVFITPDLTPQEQIQNKQLCARISELNKQDKLYRIKNGKIVLREAS